MAIRFLELSALATAAIPGLDVVEASDAPFSEAEFDSALVRERSGRLLLVRAPRTPDAAREQRAEARAIAAMTPGVRSRLPFEVPTMVGLAPDADAQGAAAQTPQVAVSVFIAGRAPEDPELSPGSPLLRELGEAIAAVHALPREFAIEAGLPQRSAGDAREGASRLVMKAKGTGRLPAVLERRWLAAIDDPTLWQFQPCVSHGGLDLDSFLEDAGRLASIIDWSDLRIGDPARDLRWATSIAPAASREVFEAYGEARGAGVDRQLRQRANLYAELELARWLDHAVALDDAGMIEDAERLLDELVSRVRQAAGAPLVHETLPVLDLEEVRDLLRDAKGIREQQRPANPNATGPVRPAGGESAQLRSDADEAVHGDEHEHDLDEVLRDGEAEADGQGDERDGGREGAPAASEADSDEDALPDADFLRDDERPEGSR
ncbi:hypothetical protein USB125703_01457 [Pseudoclavibacter triregionum]|nr:hypothetical protein USB125703_01457 [Pseudoclavibacter triregionum]